MRRLAHRGLVAAVALTLMHCAARQEDKRNDSRADPKETSSPAGPSTSPNEKQGVRGKVLKKKGNFMPGPDAPKGQTTPLSVPVHVFRGKLKPIETPNPKHPSLITTVKSGSDGSFAIGLAPGEYTVVAEIDGKLYLNLFDGDGNWLTVTVKEGAFAEWTIEDTSEAAF